VYTAESGAQALQMLDKIRPIDLLLVGLFMSEMNEVECIRRVRAMEEDRGWQKQTIVAMSAEETLMQEALQVGADSFLSKFSLPIKSIVEIIDQVSAKNNHVQV
jgi:CheY-like chemotaxis protein